MASLYTYGFFLAAVTVALMTGALVAFLLRPTGLPYRETWIATSLLVVVVPLLTMIMRRRNSEAGRE